MSKKFEKPNFNIKEMTDDKEIIFTPNGFSELLTFINDLSLFVYDGNKIDTKILKILDLANLSEKDRKMVEKLFNQKMDLVYTITDEVNYFIQQCNDVLNTCIKDAESKGVIFKGNLDKDYDYEDMEDLGDLLNNEEDLADKYSC